MTHRPFVAAVAVLALAPATAAARPSDFPEDHSFIVNAAHANHAEIAAAKLALNKSDDPGIRAYARRMITDHTKAQAQLKKLGAAWSTKVPSGPSAAQKREAAALKSLSGASFERTYLKRQVVDHREALGVMLVEASGGKVAGLRSFAAATAPVVRMHLQMAQALR